MKKIILAVLILSGEISGAVTASESHDFHITGTVTYRCYAGYDGKKVFDERTKATCDNKTEKSKILDRVVSVPIVDEKDPENSKELAGDWSQTFEFKGRKFTVALSLFKSPSDGNPYRVRLVAYDDEPSSRSTDFFARMKSVPQMNPISIGYHSAGKKEEIQFWVEVESDGKSKSNK